MPKAQSATIAPSTAIARSPSWTNLPLFPVNYIQADHRIETNIDYLGNGQVRVKPGYPSVNLDEIRYGHNGGSPA